MSDTDGGSAFPMPSGPSPSGNGMLGSISGMSLRDYFAAQTLAGIFNLAGEPTTEWSQASCEKGAASAYRIADAMLAERAKS